MGYKRLITYILQSETGASLRAANWREVGKCGGGTWNRKERPRVDTHPIGQKTLFEIYSNSLSAASITESPNDFK